MEDNIETGNTPGGVAKTPEEKVKEKIQPLQERGVQNLNQGEMKQVSTLSKNLQKITRFLRSNH